MNSRQFRIRHISSQRILSHSTNTTRSITNLTHSISHRTRIIPLHRQGLNQLRPTLILRPPRTRQRRLHRHSPTHRINRLSLRHLNTNSQTVRRRTLLHMLINLTRTHSNNTSQTPNSTMTNLHRTTRQTLRTLRIQRTINFQRTRIIRMRHQNRQHTRTRLTISLLNHRPQRILLSSRTLSTLINRHPSSHSINRITINSPRLNTIRRPITTVTTNINLRIHQIKSPVQLNRTRTTSRLTSHRHQRRTLTLFLKTMNRSQMRTRQKLRQSRATSTKVTTLRFLTSRTMTSHIRPNTTMLNQRQKARRPRPHSLQGRLTQRAPLIRTLTSSQRRLLINRTHRNILRRPLLLKRLQTSIMRIMKVRNRLNQQLTIRNNLQIVTWCCHPVTTPP